MIDKLEKLITDSFHFRNEAGTSVHTAMSGLVDDMLTAIQRNYATDSELEYFFGRCEEHLSFITKETDKGKIVAKDISSGLPHRNNEVYNEFKDGIIIPKENNYLETRIKYIIKDILLATPNVAKNNVTRLKKYWMRTRKGLLDETIVILINGSNQVGKDTFVDLVKSSCTEAIHNISTVDKIKEAAIVLGWDGEKTDENREALHQLKLLGNKFFNHAVNYVSNFVKHHKGCIIFVHTREPAEIEFFKENIPLIKEHTTCLSLLITNDRVVPASNSADSNVLDAPYDATVENNGSMHEFKLLAKDYLTNILRSTD